MGRHLLLQTTKTDVSSPHVVEDRYLQLPCLVTINPISISKKRQQPYESWVKNAQRWNLYILIKWVNTLWCSLARLTENRSIQSSNRILTQCIKNHVFSLCMRIDDHQTIEGCNLSAEMKSTNSRKQAMLHWVSGWLFSSDFFSVRKKKLT